MDRLCIDLIGPINPPYGEFYYVFVIIDSFSRFLQLYGRKHDFGNFEYTLFKKWQIIFDI
jgi:hypothetical protein